MNLVPLIQFLLIAFALLLLAWWICEIRHYRRETRRQERERRKHEEAMARIRPTASTRELRAPVDRTF
jgi:large-conductance mechanosensitive channel